MSYLEELESAVVKLHGCEAKHVETVPVKEVFRGEVAWFGNVVVFALEGHAKAKRCYAWGADNEKGGLDITTVLEIPPVTSPQSAVKVAIAAKAKGFT